MPTLYLKDYRKLRNMTQETLSRKSGVSKSYISELENNLKCPTLNILCVLARALDVDPRELFKC